MACSSVDRLLIDASTYLPHGIRAGAKPRECRVCAGRTVYRKDVRSTDVGVSGETLRPADGDVSAGNPWGKLLDLASFYKWHC